MNYLVRQLVTAAVLAIIALGSVFVIVTSPRTGTYELANESERLLPNLAEGDPRRLTLIAGSVQIDFARRSDTQDGWFAEAPFNMPADGNAIGNVIAALSEMRIIRRVNVPNSLRDMGIDAARFAWRVVLARGEWTVKFGAPAQGVRQGTYVGVTNGTQAAPAIYVVDVQTSSLDVLPEQLLDTRLLRALPEAVREYAVDSPALRLHAREDANAEHWFSVESPHIRLKHEQVAALFSSLWLLRVEPDHVTPRGGPEGRPGTTIDLVFQSGRTTIELLNSCSEKQGFVWTRVVDAQARQFCVNVSPLQRVLESEAETWKDTRLFTLRVDEVESVTSKVGPQTTEISRDGSEFVVQGRGLEATRLALQTGNEYLAELLSARGEIAAERLPGQPQLSDSGDYIEIRSSTAAHVSDSVVEKIILGPAMSDGGRVIERADDATSLKVDKATAEVLQLRARLQPPRR